MNNPSRRAVRRQDEATKHFRDLSKNGLGTWPALGFLGRQDPPTEHRTDFSKYSRVNNSSNSTLIES